MKEIDVNRKRSYRKRHLKNELFVCVGFLFITGRPTFTEPEDYLDFRDMKWDKRSLESDLRLGVLPPGMLIKAEGGTKIGLVMGHYNYEQQVEVLGDLTNMNETLGRMLT